MVCYHQNVGLMAFEPTFTSYCHRSLQKLGASKP